MTVGIKAACSSTDAHNMPKCFSEKDKMYSGPKRMSLHQITSLEPSGIYKQMLLELSLEATLSQGDYSGCIKSDYTWTFDQTECVQIILSYFGTFMYCLIKIYFHKLLFVNCFA